MVCLPAFGIFNVRKDVDAWDCTRGLYGHPKRENPLPHQGFEPAQVLCLVSHSDALPTELSPLLLDAPILNAPILKSTIH